MAPKLEEALGKPPDWATCYEPGEIEVGDFLDRCHVLLAVNDTACENWPRVGLEAMSAGVPIIAQNRGGWPEMIRHGDTGILAGNQTQVAYWLGRLSHEEPLRLRIAENARKWVEELSHPAEIIEGWRRLFTSLPAAPEELPSPRNPIVNTEPSAASDVLAAMTSEHHLIAAFSCEDGLMDYTAHCQRFTPMQLRAALRAFTSDILARLDEVPKREEIKLWVV